MKKSLSLSLAITLISLLLFFAAAESRDWISNPADVISSGDPVAAALVKEYGMEMPSPGLSPEEITNVLSYLESARK